MNQDVKERRKAPLQTPTDLGDNARRDISGALNALLADVFALYLKTKNFHWHVSGPHFRDYHLMFDEQADQIFAITDDIAERVRKIGGTTLRSIGDIAKLQRVKDNDAEFVPPRDMLRELMNDNKAVIGVNLGHLWDHIDMLRREMLGLLADCEAGRIKPVVDRSFPLERAADAHRFMQERRNVGKVLLVP